MNWRLFWYAVIPIAFNATPVGLEQPVPRHPFVYHYQWPVQFGDQRMTICLGPGGDNDECPRGYTSSEL